MVMFHLPGLSQNMGTAPGCGDPTPSLPRVPQQLKVQGGLGMLLALEVCAG